MVLPFGYILNADFSGNGLAFVALAFVLTLFVIMTNRRSSQHGGALSKGQLALLLGLRIGGAMLLLLLVFDPQISLDRNQTIPKQMAVIIDQSSSMADAWEGTEHELLSAVSGIIQSLDHVYETMLWGMDGTPLDPDAIEFKHNVSVFDWSPDEQSGDDSESAYQAVFLISDGQLNGGRSPLDLPWTETLPIYPVYPLEPPSNTVLKILKLSYDSDGSGSNEITVKVKIQAEGVPGRTASLVIYDQDGQVRGERSIILNSTFAEYGILVQYSDSGKQSLMVSLALKNGTLRSEKRIIIDPTPSKKQVFLVSERVNELHKFLLRNFPDSLFVVRALLGTTADMEIQAQTFTADFTPDLIVLNQTGPKVLSESVLALIEKQVNSHAPVILFHDGSEPIDQRLQDILEITIVKAPNSGSAGIVDWSQAALQHPLYLEFLGKGLSPADLLNYPPIRKGSMEIVLEGTDLLVTGHGSQSYPVVSVRNTPPMAIIAGGEVWRWFFHPQVRKSFLKLWQSVQIYLDEIATFKPVSIEVPVEIETAGTLINADILIRDLENRPISTAEVRAWQEYENGGRDMLDLSRVEPGHYTGMLQTNQPSEIMVVAEAYRFGELWGRDTSRIKLVAYDGETQSQGVSEVFLTRLATRSGGSLVRDKHNLPELPRETYLQKTSVHMKGMRSTFLLVTLITLWVLEWILRRRNGLL